MGCMYPARLLCPWDSPAQNTGVGSLFLLQGIFPTQESNPGFLHCRWILYQLSCQGSPLSFLSSSQKLTEFWPPLPEANPLPLTVFISSFLRPPPVTRTLLCKHLLGQEPALPVTSPKVLHVTSSSISCLCSGSSVPEGNPAWPPPPPPGCGTPTCRSGSLTEPLRVLLQSRAPPSRPQWPSVHTSTAASTTFGYHVLSVTPSPTPSITDAPCPALECFPCLGH